MQIIINGTTFDNQGNDISYETILFLSGVVGKPNVTYEMPKGLSGVMEEWSVMDISDGMVFNVSITNNS